MNINTGSRDRFDQYGGEIKRPIPKKLTTFYQKSQNTKKNADLDFDFDSMSLSPPKYTQS